MYEQQYIINTPLMSLTSYLLVFHRKKQCQRCQTYEKAARTLAPPSQVPMFQSQENGLLYFPDYFFSWLAKVNSGQITLKPQMPWMTLLLMANAWSSGGMHMGLSAFPATHKVISGYISVG